MPEGRAGGRVGQSGQAETCCAADFTITEVWPGRCEPVDASRGGQPLGRGAAFEAGRGETGAQARRGSPPSRPGHPKLDRGPTARPALAPRRTALWRVYDAGGSSSFNTGTAEGLTSGSRASTALRTSGYSTLRSAAV